MKKVKLGWERLEQSRAEQKREELRREEDDIPKEKSGAERGVGTRKRCQEKEMMRA